VVLRHILAGQGLQQNGSIIFERPFAKKSGISLRGKVCASPRRRSFSQNDLPIHLNGIIGIRLIGIEAGFGRIDEARLIRQ
jgi:hypothetical protein